MNILLLTRFSPSVGGIETLAQILCREWREMGHQVTVATDMPSPEIAEVFPFPVHYRENQKLLIALWRKHDVAVMMNVSLKAMLPMFVTQTTVLFTHHSPYWIDRKGARDWRERLKLAIARRGRYNLCVSQFIRDATGLSEAVVVPNCYDDTVFRERGGVKRPRSIVFVGRLVSDKGADLLLDALSHLPAETNVELTVIGDGPERPALEMQAASLKSRRIRFTGSLRPEAVAAELIQHEILVVPSLWKEPFGIVALEGMACGCVPLVSDGGGLPEAVGDAGRVFESGNVEDLANQISKLLEDKALCASLRAFAPSHLARHTAREMATAYLQIAEDAISGSSACDARVNTRTL